MTYVAALGMICGRVMMDKQDEKKKKSFEETLAELEKIVAQVEQGKIGLEESIAKYEEGMKLIKHCRGVLDTAEKKIETISKEASEKPQAAD